MTGIMLKTWWSLTVAFFMVTVTSCILYLTGLPILNSTILAWLVFYGTIGTGTTIGLFIIWAIWNGAVE